MSDSCDPGDRGTKKEHRDTAGEDRKKREPSGEKIDSGERDH